MSLIATIDRTLKMVSNQQFKTEPCEFLMFITERDL